MPKPQGDDDIDIKQYQPDWTKFSISKNFAGDKVITVPLNKKGGSKAFLTELGLIVDKEGTALGMIKEYMGNPYKGKTEMHIYTGFGRMFQSGVYDPQRKELIPDGKFVNKSSNIPRTKSGPGGGINLEEVVIVGTPPPDPSWPPVIDNPGIPVYPGNGGGGAGGDGDGESIKSIIRDSSVNSNEQISCLLDKILNSSNRANQKFLKGFMDNAKYNVTFKAAAVIPTATGSANASTVTTSGSKNIDIYIKTSYVEANSMWNVARTIIHEMAHAYLSQKLISIGGASNLAQNLNNKEFKDLFEYYTKFVNPTTGQLSTTANGNFEHAAMAGLLIDDMARGIQDFVEMNTPSIKNEASVTFDNYKAIAWLGLTNTGAYDSFKAITGETDASQQLRITTVQVNTTNACN